MPEAVRVADLDTTALTRLRGHLERLYGHERAAPLLEVLAVRLAAARAARAGSDAGATAPARTEGASFDERDVWLIAYPDQLHEPGRTPLASLGDFLASRYAGALNGVHVLPFHPATSDDGFAVADFARVDPAFGSWDDLTALSRSFRLMVDAVFNHVSASHPWFRGWCEGNPAYADWFPSLPPETDVSSVVRPRALPLLTPFETVGGLRSVWTTFSADQVDLDYRNPSVLLATTEVLLRYLEAGAGIVRLDAVAYLWKRLATGCIHLPETHEVIRFWRAVVDLVAPGTLLITETNVPHAENVSYFGDGTDEAQLVYQFPLAPLVLSAFHLADATTLREWARDLRTPSDSTAFFNFLGSHDGVGVRPAEGLLTPAEIDHLVQLCKAHGGGVTYRTNVDGSLSPYELNTVFFDALTPVGSPEPWGMQVQRFLAAQSVLLALAGVPGIYFQALVGSRNWHEGVRRTGQLRAINRQRYERAALEAELDDPRSLRHAVSTGLLRRIRARVGEPAFHPNGAQRIIGTGPGVFAFEREAPDGSARVQCLHNVRALPQRLRLGPSEGLRSRQPLRDLLTGSRIVPEVDGTVEVDLAPHGVAWLAQR